MSGRTDEIERYKRAMTDAFQQLDWVIGYLQGIHKQNIARALSENRQHIATQIAGEKDETELPTQEGKAAEE